MMIEDWILDDRERFRTVAEKESCCRLGFLHDYIDRNMLIASLSALSSPALTLPDPEKTVL